MPSLPGIPGAQVDLTHSSGTSTVGGGGGDFAVAAAVTARVFGGGGGGNAFAVDGNAFAVDGNVCPSPGGPSGGADALGVSAAFGTAGGSAGADFAWRSSCKSFRNI